MKALGSKWQYENRSIEDHRFGGEGVTFEYRGRGPRLCRGDTRVSCPSRLASSPPQRGRSPRRPPQATVEAMAYAARQRFTFDEYLLLEDVAGVKHEYLDGQAWARAGGSPEHAGVAGSVLALLAARLQGKPCRVFSSDLRVRVTATGLGTYPDVTVVCGSLELDPEDKKGHTVTNPRVIVEVLSPSTEDYDRGEKLAHYKQIASLNEILLVAHDRHEVEIVRRESDGSWSRWIARDAESARVETLDCELPVPEIYRDPLRP